MVHVLQTGFLSPGVAMASLDKDTTLKIQDLLKQYFEGVDKGLKEMHLQMKHIFHFLEFQVFLLTLQSLLETF